MKNVQIGDIIQKQQATNAQIIALTIVRKNCSLKCISIVQAVLELDNSYKVFAFLSVLLPTVVVLFVRKFLFNVVSALCVHYRGAEYKYSVQFHALCKCVNPKSNLY
jgi:hypothetical protein